MSRARFSLFVLLASCVGTPQTEDLTAGADGITYNVPIAVDASFAEGRIIVGHQAGSALPGRIDFPAGQFSGLELSKARDLGGISAALYTLPAGVGVVEAVEELRTSGQYLYVEPDYERTASASVDDSYRSYQWNFDAVDAESAWDYSTGSGVVVAILDTGVSTAGPYDGLGSVMSGYDFANGDSNPTDDNGHGTHVAGTVAQATNNAAGVAGLAYDATIMPVKVLDRWGSGYTSDVVDGINYAVSNGANVINMSLGSSSYSSSEASAVSSAYSAGVFVAAASGNGGSSSVDYPAGYSGAVAVGATRYGDVIASYSSRGSALDLVAPGGDTSRDDNGDGYADGVLQETFSGSSWSYYFYDGTSMATPHVAASAALLMAVGASNSEAETYLKDYATDLGGSGWDSTYGYGLIQPAAALAAYTGATPDTGTPPDTGVDTGTPPDTGDSGEPPVADCEITITTAEYRSRKGRLRVFADSDDASATLELYVDGVYGGELSYNSRRDRYQTTVYPSWSPSTVEVTSDCGGSDSASITYK